VPAYLEGAEPASTAGVPDLAPPADATEPPARTGLVIFLLLLSAAMVGGSAYFTFKTDSIDPDSEYTALAPDRVGSIRPQLPGTYVTGKGPGSRTITIRADGTVTMIELGRDNTVADKRDETYKLLLHDGNMPVARMEHFGPIEIRDPKTLFYAGEIYSRQP
jgi:hypothetical protein